jgi:hypothetical protein
MGSRKVGGWQKEDAVDDRPTSNRPKVTEARLKDSANKGTVQSVAVEGGQLSGGVRGGHCIDSPGRGAEINEEGRLASPAQGGRVKAG